MNKKDEDFLEGIKKYVIEILRDELKELQVNKKDVKKCKLAKSAYDSLNKLGLFKILST